MTNQTTPPPPSEPFPVEEILAMCGEEAKRAFREQTALYALRDSFIPPSWLARLDVKLGTAPALVLTWIKLAMLIRLGPKRTRELLQGYSGPHLGGYDV